MFGFNVKEVDVAALKVMVEQGTEVRMIDVRTPAEVAAGAIPGAAHIPLHLLPSAVDQIPEEGTVIIYCRTGARSAQACAYLQSLGKENVYNLRGGIIAWVQGGLSVA